LKFHPGILYVRDIETVLLQICDGNSMSVRRAAERPSPPPASLQCVS